MGGVAGSWSGWGVCGVRRTVGTSHIGASGRSPTGWSVLVPRGSLSDLDPSGSSRGCVGPRDRDRYPVHRCARRPPRHTVEVALTRPLAARWGTQGQGGWGGGLGWPRPCKVRAPVGWGGWVVVGVGRLWRAAHGGHIAHRCFGPLAHRLGCLGSGARLAISIRRVRRGAVLIRGIEIDTLCTDLRGVPRATPSRCLSRVPLAARWGTQGQGGWGGGLGWPRPCKVRAAVGWGGWVVVGVGRLWRAAHGGHIARRCFGPLAHGLECLGSGARLAISIRRGRRGAVLVRGIEIDTLCTDVRGVPRATPSRYLSRVPLAARPRPASPTNVRARGHPNSSAASAVNGDKGVSNRPARTNPAPTGTPTRSIR